LCIHLKTEKEGSSDTKNQERKLSCCTILMHKSTLSYKVSSDLVRFLKFNIASFTKQVKTEIQHFFIHSQMSDEGKETKIRVKSSALWQTT
jgi:hypothetical protein